jgi:hypothetical protein
MSACWKFPSNSKGSREGFNATGIAIFAGGLVQSFVREVIQNSLDARVAFDKPVEVVFDIVSLNKNSIPELTSLKPHLALAQRAENMVQASTQEGRLFYERAISSLDSTAAARLLAVHDFNTTGLTGPTEDNGEDDQEIGGWLGLVKGSGITKKDSPDALGSFGQGAKAPFAISALRTVFYFSRTSFQGALSDRFQGKSILQTMRLGDRDNSQATGYFGDPEELGPILDGEVPKWAETERAKHSQETGTSIFIADPHLPDRDEDLWFEISVAVISNYYFAIRQGNLAVNLGDGTRLDQGSLESVFNSLNLIKKMDDKTFSEEVRDGMQSVLTIHEAKSLEADHGIRVSDVFGEYFWFARVGGELQSRAVGVARKSGMLITRSAENLKVFRGVKPFDLFICVTGVQGSEILRDFENPEHNKFQFDRVTDPKKRKDFESKYQIFAKEIRSLIAELASYEILERANTSDLDHLLGGYLDEATGSEIDETSRRVRVGKRVKRAFVPGEGVSPSEGETEGKGFTGGEGGEVEPGGSATSDKTGTGAPGPEQLAGNRLDRLRIVPTDEVSDGLVKIKVHITGPFKGIGRVWLNVAGETERTRTPFATAAKKDPLPTHDLTFKKGERKVYEWWIPVTALDYALEGVVLDVTEA